MLIPAPHPAPTGTKAGQRGFIPPGCSQECCSSTSTRAQKMGWSSLLLCSHKKLLNYHEIIISPLFWCCFESRTRQQLLIFLSHKSPFPDTWKLGRAGEEKTKIKGRWEGRGTAEGGLSLIFNFNFFLILHTLAGWAGREIKNEDGLAKDGFGIRGKAKPLLHSLLLSWLFQNIPIVRGYSEIFSPCQHQGGASGWEKKAKFGSNSSETWALPMEIPPSLSSLAFSNTPPSILPSAEEVIKIIP